MTRRDFIYTDEIIDILLKEVGETGNAKVCQDGSLYIQAEVNASWMFHGVCHNPERARRAIDEFFRQR